MNSYPTYRFISGPVVPAQRRRIVAIWNGTGSGKVIKVIGAGTYTRPSASHAVAKPTLQLNRVSDLPSSISLLTVHKALSTDPDLPSQISGIGDFASGMVTSLGFVAAGSQCADDNALTNPNHKLYSCFPSTGKRKAFTIREGTGVTLAMDTWNVVLGSIVGYIDFYLI